ncbi:MAG: hypothetical protein EAZ91_05360 [Cytophagales bacterium]|nr:MAG: hypothetical protein EAZ91_05360 [Cytophagales bacterium]
MKRFLLPFACTLFILLQACTNKPNSEQTNTASTALTNETSTVPAGSGAALSSRLRDIGMNTESDWRGINVGDPATKVRETEKAKLFENDAKHLGYTLEFANLESIDMQYQLGTDQTVTGIDVDLYLNDAQSVDAYKTDLKRYFDARYKPAQTPGTWQGEGGKKIALRDVSKGKDYGLKVAIN